MRQHKYRYWYSGKMEEVGQIDFFENGTYRVNDELVGGVLMEFTGLKDKNGKEIYEGDIVSSNGKNTEYYYIVQFGDNNYGGVLGWELVDKNGNENKYYYGTRASNLSDYYEIIGNIYENPELLSSN